MFEDVRRSIKQMKNRKCAERKITILEQNESKQIRMNVRKRNVCRMQSCRRHNDGNMIGPKFGNNNGNSNSEARCTFHATHIIFVAAE